MTIAWNYKNKVVAILNLSSVNIDTQYLNLSNEIIHVVNIGEGGILMEKEKIQLSF